MEEDLDYLRLIIQIEFNKSVSNHVWGNITRNLGEWTSVVVFPSLVTIDENTAIQHARHIRNRMNVQASGLGVIEDPNMIRLIQYENGMYRHRLRELDSHYVDLVIRRHLANLHVIDIDIPLELF